MSTFVLFTHTDWSEAPRLRHQLTRLLLESGHKVLFFEKSCGLLGKSQLVPTLLPNGPAMVRTRRLCHHQLRLVPPIHHLNARVLEAQIRRVLADQQLGEDVVVINFNYDYFFLRRLFPRTRIVTIINDDFEAMSRLPFHGHMTWALKRTCEMSDSVLAVSTPLIERLREFCHPKLLLPWSVIPYRRPAPGVSQRNILLFWGYINERLDLDVLARLAEHLLEHRPGFRIMLVGPTQGNDRAPVVARLGGYANVEIRDRTDLDALPLDQILAAMIPYRPVRVNDAILQSNKTLQLLAMGLPLLVSGMPAFMQRPYIKRLDGQESLGEVLDSLVQNFEPWQPAIKQCVDENSPESRMEILGIQRAAFVPA